MADDLERVPADFRERSGQRPAKYSWIWRTAMAPSPTADATRFTELRRTSPAANNPGRLVSSVLDGSALVDR